MVLAGQQVQGLCEVVEEETEAQGGENKGQDQGSGYPRPSQGTWPLPDGTGELTEDGASAAGVSWLQSGTGLASLGKNL